MSPIESTPFSSKSIALSNLPLRPSTLSILTRCGFIRAHEVLECCGDEHNGGVSVSALAAELHVSLAVAASILREVHSVLASTTTNLGGNSKSAVTAASILEQVLPNVSTSATAVPPLRPIVSFVQSIDMILGGGFFPREVTEIVGSPGSGKTQMAMQLCVDARLPRDFGGVGGGAFYLDTEGSFSPERCWDMAKSLVEHVHASARKSQRKVEELERDEVLTAGKRKKVSHGVKEVPSDFTPEAILDGIHVFHIHDEATQTATILALSQYIDMYQKKHGFPVKIVVLDSIAFHYRSIASDYKSRTRSILSLVHSLSELANKYDLAVVLINQMTTQVTPSLSYKSLPSNPSTNVHAQEQEADDTNTVVMEGDCKLIPALGASFAHSTTTRILVMQDPMESIHTSPTMNGICTKIPRRVCKLIKSPHKPVALAYFYITDQGIRDWSKAPTVSDRQGSTL